MSRQEEQNSCSEQCCAVGPPLVAERQKHTPCRSISPLPMSDHHTKGPPFPSTIPLALKLHAGHGVCRWDAQLLSGKEALEPAMTWAEFGYCPISTLNLSLGSCSHLASATFSH